jgi:N-acetylmuramoyl-L-alanine amidase
MAAMKRLTAVTAFVMAAAAAPLVAANEASPPVAVGARLVQDASDAKLVFDLSQPVEARIFALTSPDRIVVDLPEINFQLDPSIGHVSAARDASLVKDFRFGLLAPGKSRIVIDLVRQACPSEVTAKPIVDGALAARLTVELKPCDAAAFEALGRASAASNLSTSAAPPAKPPVIVLDPGHGGADGGARGIGGAQEKTLVLEFCSELRRQLEATRRYAIVMTRDGDQYVDLDDRVRIARAANASLFMSIHADILNEAAGVSGSTVYTAADRASDAEAARIAARENAADRAGGSEMRPADPDVADILFDLKRRETRAYAHTFSRGLVENLQGATKLNHKPERSAGFVVLKAPEFPSVLIELGYLSNAQDVKALYSPEWRATTAAAIVKSIDAFFAGPDTAAGPSAGEAGLALTVEQGGSPSGH